MNLPAAIPFPSATNTASSAAGRPAGATGARATPDELRRLLARQFPQAIPKPSAALATGVPALDEALGGGLPRGALTTVRASEPGAPGQLLLCALLWAARQHHDYAALVDAADQFDPEAAGPETCEHLLWVRCKRLAQAARAADVLLRDENFPCVLLDLRGCPADQLHRLIKPSDWYRLQRLCAQKGGVLAIFAPAALAIPSARLQLHLPGGQLTLDALESPREELLANLRFQIQGTATLLHQEDLARSA